MTRITLTLQDDEKRALMALSQQERRHPREQAAWLLRKQLQAAGAIPAESTNQASAVGDPPDGK